MGALRPQSFYKFNIFIKPNVQMLTGRSGGVGTGVPPHLAALRPSETVGRPHCSVAPATGSSDSGSGGAVPSLCCFHLPTASQGERKALLGRGPEPWLLARGRPQGDRGLVQEARRLGRSAPAAGPVCGQRQLLGAVPGKTGARACCPLGPLLPPADIWGFDPFFFNLLLLRCIS